MNSVIELERSFLSHHFINLLMHELGTKENIQQLAFLLMMIKIILF